MTSQCRGLRGTPRRFGGRSVEMHSLSMSLDLHHSANAVEGGSQIRFPMYLWHLNIYEKRGQRCRRKIQPTKGRSFSEKPLDTDKGGHTLEFTLPTIPKQPVMLSTEKRHRKESALSLASLLSSIQPIPSRQLQGFVAQGDHHWKCVFEPQQLRGIGSVL